MRTLGLIGGMSAESTVPYYQLINRAVSEGLGGLHSAQLLLYSVDFAPIADMQAEGRWEELDAAMVAAARALQAGGAEALVICTNTMHKCVPAIEAQTGLPVLHIADAAAAAVREAGLTRVALLGTRFTMEQDFYRGRIAAHGIDVLTPGEADRAQVHRVIYDELCRGRILEESRATYRRIIADLIARGAQGVVLGCTEIGLLVTPEDSAVPQFDTTVLHARAAAAWSLGEAMPAPPRNTAEAL
jgi:aspartate racemase